MLALRSYALTVVLEPDVACSTIGSGSPVFVWPSSASFFSIGGTGSASDVSSSAASTARRASATSACATTMYKR